MAEEEVSEAKNVSRGTVTARDVAGCGVVINRTELLLAARHLDPTEGVGYAGRTLTRSDQAALRALLDLAAEYINDDRAGAHYMKEDT